MLSSDPGIYQKSNFMGESCAIDVEKHIKQNSKQLYEYESERKDLMKCYRDTMCSESAFNMNEKAFVSNELKTRVLKKNIEQANRKIMEKKIDLLTNVIEVIDVTIMEYNNKIESNIDSLLEKICSNLKTKKGFKSVDERKYTPLINDITTYLNDEIKTICNSQQPQTVSENNTPLEKIIFQYINVSQCPLMFVKEYNPNASTYVKNLLKMSFKTILSDPGDFINKFKDMTECSLNAFSDLENTMLLDHSKKQLSSKIIKYVLTTIILEGYKKDIQQVIDLGYTNLTSDPQIDNVIMKKVYNQVGFTRQFKALQNEID